jgi:GntR family transcriptional repressor for pyruvate dehydrogenase complex
MVTGMELTKREKLSRYVFDDLKKRIMDGTIKTGEYLKTEPELCIEYRVSRTTVRDAVSSLEKLGFVEKQQGKGVFVIEHSTDAAADAIRNLIVRSDYAMSELFQVRDVLERSIVVLAARNATKDDIEELSKWVSLMNQEDIGEAKYAEYDLKFHLTLAKVSKNPIFCAVVQGLYPYFWEMIQDIIKEGGKLEKAHKFHAHILMSIKEQNEVDALKHINDHLKVTKEIVDEIERRRSKNENVD